MDIERADGQFMNALSEGERAALAAIVGFLTIPVVSLVIIDELVWRAVAALVAFVIGVPTWWAVIAICRGIYRDNGYLRVDRGLLVGAGAVPIVAILTYILSRGASESPSVAIVLASIVTTGGALISYLSINRLLEADAFHSFEGDWIGVYRDEDAHNQASEAHEFDLDADINFESLYILLFVELALLLNVNLVAQTVQQQAFAFLLTVFTILVPFLVMVGLRAMEHDGEGPLSERLAPSFIYAFVAVFVTTVLVFSLPPFLGAILALGSFFPFVVFAGLVVQYAKPGVFAAIRPRSASDEEAAEEHETDG